jgi:hypothetical protein
MRAVGVTAAKLNCLNGYEEIAADNCTDHAGAGLF